MTSQIHENSSCIDETIVSRRAVRRFLPNSVSRNTIQQILDVARSAPSALNTQPWQVYVLSGSVKASLSNAVCAAYDAGDLQPDYATDWFGKYQERRRDFGSRFYSLLGIDKGEREKLHNQQKHNYHFYSAPIGLIFTIDRNLERGSWADYGMFLQSIMLAARARGLDTCPQGCWCSFPHVIARELSLADHETVVCGMALGYADQQALEQQLITPRLQVNEFTFFKGFD